ncbi:MAG: ExeA family protein [Planctomycetota bacterium]
MYLEAYGLREHPFRQDFDPKFIYYTRAHEETLTRMMYAVNERKGGILVTGRHGTGKTMLSRVLAEELSQAGFQVVRISHGNLAPEAFLADILWNLGIPSEGKDKAGLWHAVLEAVRRQAQADRETVVIMDEAQSLHSPETFNELVELMNIEVEGVCPVHVVVLADNEFLRRIDSLGSLGERLFVRSRLGILNREDAEGLLRHRLAAAGCGRALFSPAALDALHRASGGVPRSLIHLADLTLLMGASEGQSQVEDAMVHSAVSDWRGL